jgi:hypothetical protein
MCDNSCSLSEEQYAERSKRLEELFGPKPDDKKSEIFNGALADGN